MLLSTAVGAAACSTPPGGPCLRGRWWGTDSTWTETGIALVQRTRWERSLLEGFCRSSTCLCLCVGSKMAGLSPGSGSFLRSNVWTLGSKMAGLCPGCGSFLRSKMWTLGSKMAGLSPGCASFLSSMIWTTGAQSQQSPKNVCVEKHCPEAFYTRATAPMFNE